LKHYGNIIAISQRFYDDLQMIFEIIKKNSLK